MQIFQKNKSGEQQTIQNNNSQQIFLFTHRYLRTLNNKTIFILIFSIIFLVGIYIHISYQTITTKQYQKSNQYHKLNYRILKQEQLNSQNNKKQLEAKQWDIQKILWIYKSVSYEQQKQNQELKRFEQINLINTIHMSKLDNYKAIQINEFNCTIFLSPQSQNQLKIILSKLNQYQTILENQYQSQNDTKTQQKLIQFISNKQPIKRRLIIYFILYQNGGIYVDNKLTIIEKFSTWIQNSINLPYINNGDKINSSIQTQCFAFFNRNYGSAIQKININRQYEFEKKLIIFPSPEDQLLACSKGSIYLQKLISTYINMLIYKQQSIEWINLNKDQNMVGKTQPYSFYKHGHLLASHSVLQQHQKYLDNKYPFQKYKKLAIDELGLVTINTNLGPRKLSFYYMYAAQQGYIRFERCYVQLSKLMIKELQFHTGKLRFAYLLQEQIRKLFINNLRLPQTQLNFIVQNSFIHEYYLKQFVDNKTLRISDDNIAYRLLKNKTQIYPKQFALKPTFINQTQNKNNPQWKQLPKKLWMIWDSGLRRTSNFIVQLCAENLKKTAENNGLQFSVVNHDNVHQYLSKATLDRIQNAINKAVMKITSATISDMWRLALILEHGGIYVDSTTFTIQQSYDWLFNITKIPSNYIWNRYGIKPHVVMFWNTYYRNEMNWVLDNGVKSVWQLSYQSNFIAANKDDILIKQWFDQFLLWITTPYQEIQQQMKQVGMYQQRWTHQNQLYLMVMDSIKYVIGKKQKQLNENSLIYKSASDYYKVWSIPGHMVGQLKFRGESNFQHQDYRINGKWQHPLYRYEYPLWYVQSIDGKILKQSKYFGHGKDMNEMLMKFYHRKKKQFKRQGDSMKIFQQIIHPQSFLAVTLLNKYVKKGMYLLSYYDNLISMRVKWKSRNNLDF